MDAGSRHANNRKEVEETLSDLDKRVDRLRVLYEQYFLGIQKTEPYTLRTEVNRRVHDIAKLKLNNTALRYRFNAIRQRISTYSAYWGRIMRSIENGTYVRNVAKVGRDAIRRGVDVPDEILRSMPPKMRERLREQRRQKRDSPGAEAATEATADVVRTPTGAIRFGANELNTEFDGQFDEIMAQIADNVVLTPTAPKLAQPAPMPAPVASTPVAATFKPEPVAVKGVRVAAGSAPVLPPGMDEPAVRDLFARFVQAKRMIGQDTKGLRYEQIVKTISAQAPKIMQKYQAQGVKFEVAIKNDKVILKAIPKKKLD